MKSSCERGARGFVAITYSFSAGGCSGGFSESFSESFSEGFSDSWVTRGVARELEGSGGMGVADGVETMGYVTVGDDVLILLLLCSGSLACIR